MAKSRRKPCLRALSQSHATFSEAFATLTLDEIREVVETVDALTPDELGAWKNPRRAVLLRTLVQLEGEGLKRAWKHLLAVVAIDALPKSTKAHRAKLDQALRALAKVPHVVHALQTAIVADGEWDRWTPELALLPVLALDGSEGAADALMVVFKAAQDLDELPAHRDVLFDHLAALETWARADSAPMSSLLAAVHALRGGHAEVRQGSPVLQLAQSLGFGTLDEFKVECQQASAARASDGTAAVRVSVRFANSPDFPFWLDVSVQYRDTIKVGDFFRFRSRQTSFGNPPGRVVDELGLGTCLELTALPAWLSRVATTLGMTFTTTVTTNVRGKKKAQVEAWLLGGAPR
jgi:hypothetical protein